MKFGATPVTHTYVSSRTFEAKPTNDKKTDKRILALKTKREIKQKNVTDENQPNI